MSPLIIFIIILSILSILYLTSGFIFAIALYIHGKRNDKEIIEYEVAEKKFDLSLLDIPHKRCYTYSRFGYKIYARFYRATMPTNKYIIDIHGRSSSSVSQLKYLDIFQKLGYNVLLPDQRNSGNSGGLFFSYGVYERHDIAKWISKIRSWDNDAEIILFGESMGAATSILTATYDNTIKGVVAYCSFSSVRDIIYQHLGKLYPRYLRVFIPAFYIVSLLFFGIRVNKTNITKKLADLPIKTLIIHSYGDTLLDIAHAKRLINANENVEYILFEDDEHARSICGHKEEFTQGIQSFLKKL